MMYSPGSPHGPLCRSKSPDTGPGPQINRGTSARGALSQMQTGIRKVSVSRHAVIFRMYYVRKATERYLEPANFYIKKRSK